jgi:hypothetical protein
LSQLSQPASSENGEPFKNPGFHNIIKMWDRNIEMEIHKSHPKLQIEKAPKRAAKYPILDT